MQKVVSIPLSKISFFEVSINSFGIFGKNLSPSKFFDMRVI